MPFELGLAVSWQKLKRANHTWLVFEARQRRADKSLSDIGGTDCSLSSVGQVLPLQLPGKLRGLAALRPPVNFTAGSPGNACLPNGDVPNS
jgi:hypothetical protein